MDFHYPAHVCLVFEALGVPEEERTLQVERVLETGHLVQIREDRGRYYLCGLPHELPISPNDSLLESLIEEPFESSASGFYSYEPDKEQLIYWSEILPGERPGADPTPDISEFLAELTEISKKLSLAGAL